jgi:hypothetical protein
MTIQITRGILGDLSPYIFFTGRASDNTSSANVKNNIDSITVDYNTDDTDYIDIIDDIMTINNNHPTYEVYKVHYSEWLDADGNSFGDAAAVVDYINDEIAASASTITGENSLAQPRIGGQNFILASLNAPFTYDATHINGIGYYWDESSFPTGVEVSRYDRRKLNGTISQVGTYIIDLEISNRNGILPTNVTIQVL